MIAIDQLSRISKTRQGYASIKGKHVEKVEMYISQKPKLTCRSCSALNQHHKLFANINEVTWKQLEDYLVQNYCEYLASCDVYCNGFVVIKNSGSRPNLMNKSKILTFNAKLVKDSKIGSKFL